MSTKNYLFTIFVLIPFISMCQQAWTRISPLPQENSINKLIKIPGTDRMIAAGTGALVMTSEDGGQSWNFKYNPAQMDNDFTGHCLEFIDANTGFIGGSNRTILKTSNGGYTWSPVFEGAANPWGNITDIAFCNETTGFAVGGHTAILKTTDAGESWESFETGNDFNLQQVEFFDESTGFITAASDSPMLKTTNGGADWMIIDNPTGLENLHIQDMYFLNETTGFIYADSGMMASIGLIAKTTDAGESWNIVHDDASAYSGAFDFIDDQHGVMGTSTCMYASKVLLTEDGGNNWQEVFFPSFSWQGAVTMCFYDQNKVFSAGALGMMFYSNDGGNEWQTGYDRTFWGDVYDLEFLNENTGYALAQDHRGGMAASSLFKTTDGGENWVNSGGTSSYEGAFDFIDENTGFIAVRDFGLFIYKTTDGGENWTQQQTGYDFEAQAINYYNSNLGIVAGESTVLKTTDSGLTWEVIYSLTSGWNNKNDIEIVSENEFYITGDEEFGTFLIHTTDGGNTWENLSPGNYGKGMDLVLFDSNKALLACENNAILISEDSLNTWSETTLNTNHPIQFRAMHFPTSEIGYAVGDGPFETIIKTTDGGETWFTIESITTAGLNCVHFFDDMNGLVFGENGVELKTSTGGITGFEEHTLNDKISFFGAYPNPFNDEVTISINKDLTNIAGELLIYDQTGKKIESIDLKSESRSVNISTQILQPGVYYFRVKTLQGRNETLKMIKMR